MFSRADLTRLIEATPGVGVSIYLPTQPHGRETKQNPIMLKNLLGQARDQLAELELAAPEAEALLAPAALLVDDHDFWQHQEHGLALFLSSAGMQSHKLPLAVPEVVVSGTGFHIAPLLPLLEQGAAYVILTMTAEAACLWEATRFTMSATKVTDIPASIESLDQEPDYEGTVQSGGYGRPHTGRQNISKAQVYGDSPEEWRKGRLVEYARRTTAAVAAHLASDPLRIVLVADAEIGGHVLKDETLASMIAGFVEVNPASLDETDLHAAASEVMQPIREKAQRDALERFDALLGRGDAMACTDVSRLIAAAEGGRVDQLFVVEDAVLRGSLDPETGATQVEDSDTPGTLDLLDRAAQMTLHNRGGVWVVAQDRLPDGVSMAAQLRY